MIHTAAPGAKLPEDLTPRALWLAVTLRLLTATTTNLNVDDVARVLDSHLTCAEELERASNIHEDARLALLMSDPTMLTRTEILDSAATSLRQLTVWHRDFDHEATQPGGYSDRADEQRVGIDRDLAALVPDLLHLLVNGGQA